MTQTWADADIRASALALLSENRELLDEYEQPIADRIAHFVAATTDAAHRDGATDAHITASAVLVNPGTGATLLTLHPKFGRWMQLGGHFEPGDRNVVDAVLRETTEESGFSCFLGAPVLLGVGEFTDVPCRPGHYSTHFDLRFMVMTESTSSDPLPTISPESDELAWWNLRELPARTDEDLQRLAQQALHALHRLGYAHTTN